jgi:hypothetical protein
VTEGLARTLKGRPVVIQTHITNPYVTEEIACFDRYSWVTLRGQLSLPRCNLFHDVLIPHFTPSEPGLLKVLGTSLSSVQPCFQIELNISRTMILASQTSSIAVPEHIHSVITQPSQPLGIESSQQSTNASTQPRYEPPSMSSVTAISSRLRSHHAFYGMPFLRSICMHDRCGARPIDGSAIFRGQPIPDELT